MALTNAALSRFDEAFSFYESALKYMEKVKGGELERAITYLNMADTYEASLDTEAAESKISP